MTSLATESTIRSLAERYPFDDHELNILIRCHDFFKDDEQSDFLLKLASASPYTHYFLPGDELKDRIIWIEEKVLPQGFSNSIRAAMTADSFVNYANQGAGLSLERFIEGVADTGRRGIREALRVLFSLSGGRVEEVMDHVVSLAIANEAFVIPNLDKDGKAKLLKKLDALQNLAHELSQNAIESMGRNGNVGQKTFVEWAESNFPFMTNPLSTFVHNILFHTHPYPKNRVPFSIPDLEKESNIFTSSSPLMALTFIAPEFGGKWQPLYSAETDGRSFNRLEWSLLGYSGPNILVVKTTMGSILGAYTTSAWHDSKDFYGTADCFLVELSPHLCVHRPVGKEQHFQYLHSKNAQGPLDPETHPCGLGFGGTLAKPRFFIPESLEHCSADFLDRTFESGELVPAQEMEKFEIQHLEVWGVGGPTVIQQALNQQVEYRAAADSMIERIRTVEDKAIFVEDLKSGLIPNTLYSHNKDARGRHEFRVDEKHEGGYIVESK